MFIQMQYQAHNIANKIFVDSWSILKYIVLCYQNEIGEYYFVTFIFDI